MKLPDFSGLRIAVIGDVMLDRYSWGDVTRISPEAPVPVVKLNRTSVAAGGAANVAANIIGLGATPYLIGIIGDDDEASLLPDVMANCGVSEFDLYPIKGRKTTVKTRIVAQNQQIARLDQETNEPLCEKDAEALLGSILPLLEKVDVVLLSDYAKGFLTPMVVQNLIERTNVQRKPVLVDPKGKDYSKYAGATLLTPNRHEAAEACGLDHDNVDLVATSGEILMEKLSLQALLVTQGKDGMTLFENDSDTVHLHATARTVFDVTGAGDTVIATLAVALGSGMNLVESAKLANLAAGLVVEKVGTTPITIAELRTEISAMESLAASKV